MTVTQKYVVFDAEDVGRHAPINDAVVFRMQDLFASVAIRCYSDAVANAIAVLEAQGASVPDSLKNIRDSFFEIAADAEATAWKGLPT